MSDASQDDGFLSRWSRRKRAIAAGEDLPEPVTPERESARISEQESAAAADLREKVLTENRLAAEAVDLETLNFESDFKLFLKDGVPQPLRQKALDTLWRSNPVLANLDGLNDYEENFADPARIMPTFESAYRIGKGYFFPETEDEPEDEPEKLADDAAEDEDVALAEPDAGDDTHTASPDADGASGDADALAEDGSAAPEDPEHSSMDIAQESLDEARPRVSLRKRLQFAS